MELFDFFFCNMKELFNGRWSLDLTVRGAHIHVAMAATCDMALCGALFHGNEGRERSTKAFFFTSNQWLIDAIWLGLLLASKGLDI